MSSGHDFINTGDPDSFHAIEDRNGEVVLGYCRVCKKAEVELDDTCPGAPKMPKFSELGELLTD